MMKSAVIALLDGRPATNTAWPVPPMFFQPLANATFPATPLSRFLTGFASTYATTEAKA